LSEPLLGKFDPCFHRNLEVHNSQERVNSIFFLDDSINNIIILQVLLTFVLLFEGHQVNFKLRFQLKDLHLLVDFHITVLSAHASVKKLIEIDEALIALDTHLQQMFLQFSSVKVFFAESKTFFF